MMYVILLVIDAIVAIASLGVIGCVAYNVEPEGSDVPWFF